MNYDYIEQGDCLELMKNIPDESIDLIVTDTPYLINYSRHDKNSRFSKPILNDDNPCIVSEYIKECFRILKNNSACYMFANYKTVDMKHPSIEKLEKQALLDSIEELEKRIEKLEELV